MRERAPTSGMPTSFSMPVVRPRPQVRAEAALGPAPEVVGEPDRGDEPARATQRTSSRRAAGAGRGGSRRAARRASSDVASWRPRWTKPREVAAGRAVLERQLDLLDAEPGARRVDRHPRLAAEARREREDGRARAPRESARWPGERLARLEPARAAGSAPAPRASRARSRRPAARANAATARSASPSQRAASGRRAGRRRRAAAGPAARRARRRQRLALAAARQPQDDARPAASACVGGRVARAVVGDDHLGVRGTRARSAVDRRADRAPPRRARRRGSSAGQPLGASDRQRPAAERRLGGPLTP